MAVNLGKREEKEFKKYLGWAEVDVIAVNPTQDQLEKLGVTVKEEPEYIKEVEDKDRETGDITWSGNQLRLNFWCKEVNTVSSLLLNRFLNHFHIFIINNLK